MADDGERTQNIHTPGRYLRHGAMAASLHTPSGNTVLSQTSDLINSFDRFFSLIQMVFQSVLNDVFVCFEFCLFLYYFCLF